MAVKKSRRAAPTRRPKSARRKQTPRRAAVRSVKARRSPETLRLRAFEPALTVSDLARSVRFYSDVLGFIVGDRWTDAGVLRGVSLKAGACDLMLSQDDWSKGRDRKRGEGVRLWCRTAQGVDALAARIKAAGGVLAEEPKDQPWGVRSLAVDDPDGYHLSIYEAKNA